MKKEKPKNETELKQSLLRIWHGIGTDVSKKLVDSVPNRLFGWMDIQLDIDM